MTTSDATPNNTLQVGLNDGKAMTLVSCARSVFGATSPVSALLANALDLAASRSVAWLRSSVVADAAPTDGATGFALPEVAAHVAGETIAMAKTTADSDRALRSEK